MASSLDYYEQNAGSFIASTIDADVSQLHERFLRYLPEGSLILDFGCGSGRDTKAFLASGYACEALDGSHRLCAYASKYTGIKVQCMDFLSFHETCRFDGIWACASLLHCQRDKLPSLLENLSDALKDGGVMYMSFKHGNGDREKDGRLFTDMNSALMAEILPPTLEVLEEWISTDVRGGDLPEWLNVIAMRRHR